MPLLLDAFFKEMLVQGPCPFSACVINSLMLVSRFLVSLEMNSISGTYHSHIFYCRTGCLLTPLSFDRQKVYTLIYSCLFFFLFCHICFWYQIQKVWVVINELPPVSRSSRAFSLEVLQFHVFIFNSTLYFVAGVR